MQRRGATRGRGAIHVGAGAEEELDARELTLASGVVKGCTARAPAPSSESGAGPAQERRAQLVEVAPLRCRARAAHELHLLETLVVRRALIVGVPPSTHLAPPPRSPIADEGPPALRPRNPIFRRGRGLPVQRALMTRGRVVDARPRR